MAEATSTLHRHIRGAVGDFIFRNYNGKTIVSLRPVYKNETNTEARRLARDRFREAANYASNAMENPKQKAYYQQKARQLKLPNPYTAAITDYLRKAKAVAFKPSSFSARKGETIILRISKTVFKISRIKAMLCDQQGNVLSEQHLTTTGDQKLFYLKFTDDFPDFDKLKITTDEPGDQEYAIHRSAFIIPSLELVPQ
ncbi:hypothetical protein [Chryseolinea sp. H1M3-3]|uniref:hypothetical protein n=1 Tax=Chryseolinea sp. H1M3-3 TaxID=3034144 RepID=UPI0023EE0599|nr:hypothetical protein [Chryseolinea sp. H1M3-3]